MNELNKATWPKSDYIRLYPSTDDICPPVEAYVRLSHGHRPLPHPRETLVEGEAGDLIPSFPFAEAGFGEEDARGARIVLPLGVEQGMKEGNSFVPCSVIMGWLGHYQGVYIPRSNFMDIRLKLSYHQRIEN